MGATTKKDRPINKDKQPLPASLLTMLGEGEFWAQEKRYYIRPLKLKMVEEFINDQVSIGAQLFNFTTKEAKEGLEKWLPLVLFRDRDAENGISLAEIMEDDWDLSDLRNLWRNVLELSG